MRTVVTANSNAVFLIIVEFPLTRVRPVSVVPSHFRTVGRKSKVDRTRGRSDPLNSQECREDDRRRQYHRAGNVPRCIAQPRVEYALAKAAIHDSEHHYPEPYQSSSDVHQLYQCPRHYRKISDETAVLGLAQLRVGRTEDRRRVKSRDDLFGHFRL